MVSNLYLFVVGYVYSKLTTTYTCWMTDVLSKFQACLNVKIPIFDDQSNYMAWALVWTESNWNGSDWCDWWHTKKKLKPKLSAIFIHFLSLILLFNIFFVNYWILIFLKQLANYKVAGEVLKRFLWFFIWKLISIISLFLNIYTFFLLKYYI